ncbi:DUF4124 domain-containing protein [Parachitinimonas caeni]|uniref:DUF4124 domain-containing protein n=1 Tax=Parachitinimonas caeni TaxID=3031301 RepID=A0ABT7DRG3_9NEIS|nr:DUF4124 domain-containing protein [Parachitinimonas caeni]MDK2122662.1 DUF4124 domain-containing protein [Parachitinimonas caeni]
MKHLPLFALLGGMISGMAQAEIYKYVDSEGRVTYSNMPIRGAKKLDLGPAQVISSPRRGEGGGNPSSASRSPTPSDFPKVDTSTQKQRDQGRRKILEDEMRSEQQLLDTARKALSEGEQVRTGEERNNYQKYLDRVANLRNEVTLHEKNIQALNKEISNLK